DYAPTDMLQYQNSSVFNGALAGKILMLRYSGPSDIAILTPSADGKTLTSIAGKGMDGLFNPIGIVEDPSSGDLYVSTNASQGGLNIILLKPHPLPALTGLKLINTDQGISIGALKNKATIDLGVTPHISIRADGTSLTDSVV